MIVDNFELIKKLFYFNEENNMFFHCQIVQRAKDNKNSKVSERTIKYYFIQSKEHLEKLKDEIILLCNYYNARAYINITGKDFDKLQSNMLIELATNIGNSIIKNPIRNLNSMAGKLKSRKRLWIIDIDDISLKMKVKDYIIDLFSESYKKPKKEIEDYIFNYIILEVPTVNGLHFITKPFNSEKFNKKFPEVSIHKNSMGTVLYCPDFN